MAESKTEAYLREVLDKYDMPYECNCRIGPYEIDFVIAGSTIVEVDGYHHLSKPARARDSRKDSYLKYRGYRVYRIPARDVWRKTKLRAFLSDLLTHLENKEQWMEKPDDSSPHMPKRQLSKLRKIKEKLIEEKKTKSTDTNKRKSEAPHQILQRHLDRYFPKEKKN